MVMAAAVFLFTASALCLFVAAGSFRANQRHRGAITTALAGEMKVPEEMPFYGAAYLNKFISVAEQRPSILRKSVLDLYIRPTLLWIDIRFAIFCAAFVALFWLGLLSALPIFRCLECALQFSILMAVLYGFSDVAEDLWLARLFLRRTNVTKFEGAIACALTDMKFITICLSVLGGLLFIVLGKIFANERTA